MAENPYGVDLDLARKAMSESLEPRNSIDLLYPASHPRTLEQAKRDIRESWVRLHPDIAAAVARVAAVDDSCDLDQRELQRHAAELLAKGVEE